MAQHLHGPEPAYSHTWRSCAARRGKTDGAAKNDKRATLRVVGQDMSVAIYGAHDSTNNIQIRSVTIDGNRPAMGVLAGGAALLELGGNSPGHQVTNSRILNPRGWSCLHVIECVIDPRA